MCGIFGVLLTKNEAYTPALLKETVNQLFLLSASRGKEASGLGVFTNGKLRLHKEALSARYFINTKKYKQFFNGIVNARRDSVFINNKISIIGHTRLATNGSEIDSHNNSPIIYNNILGAHNGIIVNDDLLWKKFPSIRRKGSVDSEIIFALLNLFHKYGLSLIESVRNVFKNIEGSASIAAFLSSWENIVLVTNTGSLYCCKNTSSNVFIFTSELPILQRLIKKLRLRKIIGQYNISQLKANNGSVINIHDLSEQRFNIK